MGVMLNITDSPPGTSDAFSTFMTGPLGAKNPALGIQYDSQLAWILTLICGAAFLFEAFYAASNLAREGSRVHLWVLLACFERVATHVFRAFLYKQQRVLWIKVFEVLESLGTALLVTAAYHLLAGYIRSKRHGRSCCASVFEHLLVFAATTCITAGAAAFAVGAWLQDSISQNRFTLGFHLRQYAVLGYGAVLTVYLLICFVSIVFCGRRLIALELLILGAALGAKSGFQNYSLWTQDQPLGVQRYYSNRFYFSLMVFPELIALSLLTSRSLARNALHPKVPSQHFVFPLEGVQQDFDPLAQPHPDAQHRHHHHHHQRQHHFANSHQHAPYGSTAYHSQAPYFQKAGA